MKKYLMALAAAGATLVAVSAKNDDPVLMNVAGKDVHLSEFEYLYKKNNAQQVQPQSLDEYVNMFVDYKLKVADAEAAGLDTTANFKAEYGQFAKDLSAPYLRDQAVEDSLIAAAYPHYAEVVTVSHIMLPLANKPGQPGPDPKALADSLHSMLASGKGNFKMMAREYSVDKQSAMRGGLMGPVVPGKFPWAFEDAAYNTAVGEVSPVVNSGFGYHIIKVEKREPSRGQVLAEHILRVTRDKKPEQAEAQKVTIDSIYTAVTAGGADFEDMARRFSEDPGSAKKGGKLGWFGSGVMVAEFDSVAFALPVGGISEPFRTQFGWHIIRKVDQKGAPALDDVRAEIVKAMSRDSRANMPRRRAMDRLMKQFDASIDHAALDKAVADTRRKSGLADTALISALTRSTVPVATVNGEKITLGEVMARIPAATRINNAMFAQALPSAAENAVDERVADLARADIAQNNPDYRNLLNEYRDGILLFDISQRKVWERAAQDTLGLEQYFAANRDKYTWDKPRFCSYVLFANSDSLLQEAVKFAESLGSDISQDNLVKQLRDRFGREIRLEQVIAAQGDNPITDYLGFDGPKPAAEGKRWQHYAALRPQIVDTPRSVNDVRGRVVTDYQVELEKKWMEQLHRDYPVKLNKKVLKKVK